MESTTTITHPNFKSISQNINGASDINLYIGDALNYQYLFEKKIPSSEINNWQRGGGGQELNSFRLKIHEIDRVFFIERFLLSELEGIHNGYTFIGRTDKGKTFYYVYLNGSIHPEKMNARGYLFISDNARVFLSYLNKDQRFKDSIYNFLLEMDNIIVDFTKNEINNYSSLFLKERPPFTLFNLSLEKIKNDRKYYQTSKLPRYLQNFLDYKNVQDAILESRTKFFSYYIYGKEGWEDIYSPPRHFVEFCLICSDSKTQNVIMKMMNKGCYILEYSYHFDNVNCTCTLCQQREWKILNVEDYDFEDDKNGDGIVYRQYKIPLTIHQPNMKRLCVDMLETNYCENILNFQHLFKRRIHPSLLEEEKRWGNASFQIYPQDIDQLYYIWNDKYYYHPHSFKVLQRGYFIRVMGRLKSSLIYFEMVMWTLLSEAKEKGDDLLPCCYYRDGFIFFSKDPSLFICCIIKQYSKNHQKEILRKLLNDEKTTTNKAFYYDINNNNNNDIFKMEEMKKIYYFKKYNCVKEYLKDYTHPVDPFTYNYLTNNNNNDNNNNN